MPSFSSDDFPVDIDIYSDLCTLCSEDVYKGVECGKMWPVFTLDPDFYCTLNYSCMEASMPLLHTKKEDPMNQACFWVDCGGGSCNKTSPFSYSCHCDVGYYNILNATAFPCVKQCAIGIGCSNLGIPMTNSSTTTPPPTLSVSGKNEAKVNALLAQLSKEAVLGCLC
ncbi:uncharacterized protein DS421_12g364590 [Arachis hypogaea]|nr:uncharacterized protein DS421_12g364590 [Arachis hypogaea]